MILVALGVKNQFILVKAIAFSLLVPQKWSVESSINGEVHQKSAFSQHKFCFINFLHIISIVHSAKN